MAFFFGGGKGILVGITGASALVASARCVCCPVDSLDSIKKGRKIRKGNNLSTQARFEQEERAWNGRFPRLYQERTEN